MKKKMQDKKAEIGELIKILLWVVLFLIILGGLYFLIKFLTKQ